MTLRRKTCAVLASGVLAAIVSPVTPVTAAQSLATRATSVSHSCDLVKPWGLLGAKGQGTVVSPETVTVRYPDTVAPGEVFTAYVKPGAGAMRTTNGRYAGLLSYDMAFPSNATGLLATSNGGGNGYSVPDGSAPVVDRVNGQGAPAAEGPYARIAGPATAYFGVNSKNSDAVDIWKGGLTVAPDTTFQFPEVALQMRAPVSSGGSTLAVALKGAGNQTGSKSDPTRNTIQGAEQGGWGVERTNYYFCGSSANAAALSSTFVDGALARYIAKTATSMVTPDTLAPVNSGPTTLKAAVSTDEELISNVRGGTMSFAVKSKATGAVIKTIPGVSIAADGTSSTAYQFPGLTAPNFREEYEVTATYSGKPNDIEPSTSGPTTITVGYNEINAAVDLTSTNGALAGGSMPVTLRANVALPSGRAIPANYRVQLYRNDTLLGAPVAVPAGGNSAQVTFPTDTLSQTPETRTYRYRAEIVPMILNGVDRYAGGSSTPVAAVVLGSDPRSPLPDGGQGSVDLEGFFKAPQLVWDWLTGSIGQAGTFSVSFAG